MKYRLLLILFIVVLLTVSMTAAAQVPSPFLIIAGAAFSYKGQTVLLRGENDPNLPALGAQISSGNITDSNITADDYVQLAAMGANHIRFGMSFSWYLANKAQFFQMLDQNIAWAKVNHLWFIPLLFTTPQDCYEGYS